MSSETKYMGQEDTTWLALLSPNIEKFKVAAALDGFEACWNKTGSAAMAGLLTDVAKAADQAVLIQTRLAVHQQREELMREELADLKHEIHRLKKIETENESLKLELARLKGKQIAS